MGEKGKGFFKKGTPECGLAYGLITFAFGLVMYIFGFWKMVLLLLLCAIAVFLGGVSNHEQAIKDGINKMLPQEQEKKEKSMTGADDNFEEKQ